MCVAIMTGIMKKEVLLIMRIEQSDLAVVKDFLEKTFNSENLEDAVEGRVKEVSLYISYTHEDGSQSKDVITNIEI